MWLQSVGWTQQPFETQNCKLISVLVKASHWPAGWKSIKAKKPTHFLSCWPVLVFSSAATCVFIPSQAATVHVQKRMATSSPLFVLSSCTCDELSPGKCSQMCVAQSDQPKVHVITRLHKMTFFLPGHHKSSPVRVSSCSIPLLWVSGRRELLQLLSLQVPWFSFHSMLGTIHDSQSGAVKPIIHDRRHPKLAVSCFDSFCQGGGFYGVLLEAPKEKINIKYSKGTCFFLHFQTSFKLQQTGIQQVLLVLIQNEAFNARHDVTVLACATSSVFIPFSSSLTRVILRDITWSLSWLVCFDPYLSYFSVCPLNLRNEGIH
ncbi:uncharacterized protein LOC118161982 [Oxyura jamaicensis]|uniref:uncharacterized protein LOC118161982 n=1 Tax=Oxyura jamaicensis TaxID=8884 RepID=UPI0015A5674D|nr:uncharacterized protein LOC118161982 [Oxyura jamaicensis]XP_035173722.1 uncharacterized protein LOC118161982 [Oxyura jamaicensis]